MKRFLLVFPHAFSPSQHQNGQKRKNEPIDHGDAAKHLPVLYFLMPVQFDNGNANFRKSKVPELNQHPYRIPRVPVLRL